MKFLTATMVLLAFSGCTENGGDSNNDDTVNSQVCEILSIYLADQAINTGFEPYTGSTIGLEPTTFSYSGSTISGPGSLKLNFDSVLSSTKLTHDNNSGNNGVVSDGVTIYLRRVGSPAVPGEKKNSTCQS